MILKTPEQMGYDFWLEAKCATCGKKATRWNINGFSCDNHLIVGQKKTSKDEE